MPASIPLILDVHTLRGPAAPPDAAADLRIEIPHGATATADFAAYARRLTSPLPDGLVDFFHVNTDIGAPELALATAARFLAAHPTRTVEILRCRIPRTFIDCNRRIDAAPADFKAGKVTPGLMPWITTNDDRALLRDAYDRYVAAVASAPLAPGGALLMLHSYAPRTVDVEVDHAIVPNLHAAYAKIDTYPLRPTLDAITHTTDGQDLGPRAVLDALRAGLAALPGLDLELGESATYPLHPSTLAYDHVLAHPGRALCLELRRDLLADPFDPFVEMKLSDEKLARLAAPMAAALGAWWP